MVLGGSSWKVSVRLVIGRSSVRIRPRAPHNPSSAALSRPRRARALPSGHSLVILSAGKGARRAASMIRQRKDRDGLQVQVYAGRDPLTGRKRWVSRQVPGQTKASHRQAKKVEAELLEQVDRGEQRGSRTRTVAELVERWFTWRQQVKPISPVTVANYRGAIDRYVLPALSRARLREVDAATLDALYAQVRAHGGKCRVCWQRIRRGEPPLRAGELYRLPPDGDEGD